MLHYHVKLNQNTLENSENITLLLQELQAGKKEAYSKLFPIVYRELHRIAHKIRFQWNGQYTLNTTALVHEAYLKMADKDLSTSNRKHFFAVAAKAIRQILINYALKKQTAKRGSGEAQIPIEEVYEDLNLPDKISDEILALNEALVRLEGQNEQLGKIVEYRFFAGMSIEETAELLDVSVSTIKRHWAVAKAWLYKEVNS